MDDVNSIWAFFGSIWLITLGFGILLLIANWKIYTKAGKPGWACLVPIYNLVVMLEIVKLPVWYVVLCFIPLANLGVAIMVPLKLATAFDKGTGFGFGLMLLPYIFYPILGLGESKYIYATDYTNSANSANFNSQANYDAPVTPQVTPQVVNESAPTNTETVQNDQNNQNNI